ncbi:MAG: dienelactone hydrolase family protein [Acidobacteriota bacterium]
MTRFFSPSRGLPAILPVLSLFVLGCSNHYLIHPRDALPGLVETREERRVGDLTLRLEWVEPAGDGLLPAVVVHPEAGHRAQEMRGILRSLAASGYLAVAVDYRRDDGETIFTWQQKEDALAAHRVVTAHRRVDPSRIGWMGYSQGAIYSLLIAARTEAAAVVAYYPITDLVGWLAQSDEPGFRGWLFGQIERRFRQRSGVGDDDAEFARRLALASPLGQAERIEAPVLLIHGDRDRSAPVGESRRLAQRLRELDRDVELVVLEDAGHVFNFRTASRAEAAWRQAKAWLDRYLRPNSEQ